MEFRVTVLLGVCFLVFVSSEFSPWIYKYELGFSNEIGDFIELPDGSIIISGYDTTNGNQKPYVSKISSEGDSIMWTRKIECEDDEQLMDVTYGNDGNIYILSNRESDYGSTIRKLSIDGDYTGTWISPFLALYFSLEATSDDGFIASGVLYYPPMVGVVAKLNSTMGIDWIRSFGYNDDDGEVSFQFQNVAAINGGIGGYCVVGTSGDGILKNYMITVKLDSDGEVVYFKELDSLITDYENLLYGERVAAFENGTCAFVGLIMAGGTFEGGGGILASVSPTGDLNWRHIEQYAVLKDAAVDESNGYVVAVGFHADYGPISFTVDDEGVVILALKHGLSLDFGDNWLDLTGLSSPKRIIDKSTDDSIFYLFGVNQYDTPVVAKMLFYEPLYGDFCDGVGTRVFTNWDSPYLTNCDPPYFYTPAERGSENYEPFVSLFGFDFVGTEDSSSLVSSTSSELVCVSCNFVSSLSDLVCNGGGDCLPLDICECFENYYGAECEITSCGGVFTNQSANSSQVICNGDGTCESYNVCDCSEGLENDEGFCVASTDDGLNDDDDDDDDDETDVAVIYISIFVPLVSIGCICIFLGCSCLVVTGLIAIGIALLFHITRKNLNKGTTPKEEIEVEEEDSGEEGSGSGEEDDEEGSGSSEEEDEEEVVVEKELEGSDNEEDEEKTDDGTKV